jgi:hypothetical protein
LNGPEFHLGKELAEQRVRDSLRAYDERQLVALATPPRVPRGAFVRRPAALVLAALSRRTVEVVRRLDECVAEDLGRAMASKTWT